MQAPYKYPNTPSPAGGMGGGGKNIRSNSWYDFLPPLFVWMLLLIRIQKVGVSGLSPPPDQWNLCFYTLTVESP